MAVSARKSRTSDQYNLEQRLEKIIHFHLLDMEENPDMYAAKDRLSTIQYVGMFLNRKFGWGEVEGEGVGSAVRKYAGAFRTPPHVVGVGAKQPRSARISHTSDAEPDADTEDAA